MSVLAGLEPKRVFEIFEHICSIPHGSGNTEALGKWCLQFVKQQGIVAEMDAVGNVIARKSGSAGRQEEPAVILQAHLDMVCEKLADRAFDFTKDGIAVATDGQTVWAQGTTLGADNGIGIAMILAILEDPTLSHPPIEAVLTIDEETGLEGASALDFSKLSGRRMINLDSEDEGVFTAGCAGGIRLEACFPLTQIPNTVPAYTLQIKGLTGGHSGIEINRGRQNANVILTNLLTDLSDHGEWQLASLWGGTVDNAIAAEAGCVIATAIDKERLQDIFSAAAAQLATEQDPDITIIVEDAAADTVWNREDTARILNFITAAPNGVQAMCADLPDLVETSLNLGVIRSTKDAVTVTFSLRSSVKAAKEALLSKLILLAEKMGGTARTSGDYPGWEYRSDSALRDRMVATYEACYGTPPVVEVIHAGLECGLFCEKCPDLDAISLGPDMKNVHTPEERVSVASVGRVYQYLLQLLEQL